MNPHANPKILRSLPLALVTTLVLTSGSAQAGIEIPPDKIQWAYTPEDSVSVIPFSANLRLEAQLPKNTKCCSGKYTLTFQPEALAPISKADLDRDLYLLIPMTFGLKNVWINERSALRTEKDYSAAGPIIQLKKTDLTGRSFKISFSTLSPDQFISGMQKFFIGTYDETFSKRERGLVFQRYIPLFTSGFFFLIAFAIGLSVINTGESDLTFRLFFQVLLAWAFFYISLSGVLATLSPSLAAFIHMPLRSVAGITLIRLIMLLNGSNVRSLKRITYFCVTAVLVGAVVDRAEDRGGQVLAYAVECVIFSIIGLNFAIRTLTRDNERELFYVLISITVIIFIAGSTADTIKIIGYYFLNYRFPLSYLNRITDPPLIFTSIFYLVSEAKKKIVFQESELAIQELREQVLHDLRAPTTAIKVVSSLIREGKLQPEETSVLSQACDRIFFICESLQATTKSDRTNLSKVDVSRTISRIISEKRAETKRTNIHSNFNANRSFKATVDERKLERLLSNIISNAHEASARDSPIDIFLRSEKKSIYIEVRDFGHGISKAESRNLFKKITRPKGHPDLG